RVVPRRRPARALSQAVVERSDDAASGRTAACVHPRRRRRPGRARVGTVCRVRRGTRRCAAKRDAVTSVRSPWGPLAEEPRFCLTSDQDWAPDWALEELLDWVRRRGLPLHVFRTNPSDVLDDAVRHGEITQGWHPNLAPGSSHGNSTADVVAWFTETFPGSVSIRGHGFNETFAAWSAFAAAGIRYDSQFPAAFSGHLAPMVHVAGIVRLPVFLEDDLWLGTFPGRYAADRVARTLLTPGLKIMNLHAAHLALNTPSLDTYRAHASAFYASRSAGELVH